MKRALIGAHRGAMGLCPENTLKAFEKAIEYRTYRMEFDLTTTKDREIMVLHDETVDRTTNGSGRLDEMTFEEARRLDAGEGERIPTMDEVMKLVKGRVNLMMHIKDKGIEKDVVEAVERYGMVENVVISPCNRSSIPKIRELNPRIQVGIFLEEDEDENALEDLVKAWGMKLVVKGDGEKMTPKIVNKAHSLGSDVRVGMPERLFYEEMKNRIRRYMEMEVDEISSGRPDWIGQAIEEIAQEEGIT